MLKKTIVLVIAAGAIVAVSGLLYAAIFVFSENPVSEPAVMLLVGLGLVGFSEFGRKRFS